MELNDLARGEPMHKIFMAKVSDDTNQSTPSQGDSCKVAREVVGGPRGPIVIIVEVIQCKVD
jgi:hypothetical protein